jgi:hypothetical protein
LSSHHDSQDQEKLELKSLNQAGLLVCADDVHLLRSNVSTIKKKTEVLLQDCKGIGLEENTDKIKSCKLGTYPKKKKVKGKVVLALN